MDLPKDIYQQRLARMRDSMRNAGLSCLIISSFKRNTVKYLSDFTQPNYLQSSGNCLLVVPREGDLTLIVQASSFLKKNIADHTWVGDIRVGPSFRSILDECVKALTDLRLATDQIGLVGGELDIAIEIYLKNALPKASFVDANALYNQQRMIKDTEEIKVLKRAQEIADAKFEAAKGALKVGKMESDVIAVAEYVGRVLGAENGTCDMIGFAPDDDPRLVRPPTLRKIRSREAILIEVIPFYKGYNVELIGVFALARVSREQQQLSEVVFQAYESGLRVARPGVRVSEMVEASLKVVREAGYEEFTHSAGHGIGLDNGEKPDFSLWGEDSAVLQPGMTFAFHPNISLPNMAKAVFGDVLLVTEKGVEHLSKVKPQALFLL